MLDRLIEALGQKGVRTVLLTSMSMTYFCGGALVLADIASAFRRAGMEVTITTFGFANPMSAVLEDLDLSMIDAKRSPEALINAEFDMIFASNWQIYNFILLELGLRFRFLLLNSFSSFGAYDAIWSLLDDSDIAIFNSQANLDFQRPSLGQSATPAFILNNALPELWFTTPPQGRAPTRPSSIAIISNHVQPELLTAAEIWRGAGLKVDIVGIQGEPRLVDPALIDSYDATVTIGHSVQKSLARGAACFCYDRFGGPGFLLVDNLDAAEEGHFSGRNSLPRRTAEALAQELVEGYERCIGEAKALRRAAEIRYRLEARLADAVERLQPRPLRSARLPHNISTRKVNQALLQQLIHPQMFDPLINIGGFGGEVLRLLELTPAEPNLFTTVAAFNPRSVFGRHELRRVTMGATIKLPPDCRFREVTLRSDGETLESTTRFSVRFVVDGIEIDISVTFDLPAYCASFAVFAAATDRDQLLIATVTLHEIPIVSLPEPDLPEHSGANLTFESHLAQSSDQTLNSKYPLKSNSYKNSSDIDLFRRPE